MAKMILKILLLIVLVVLFLVYRFPLENGSQQQKPTFIHRLKALKFYLLINLNQKKQLQRFYNELGTVEYYFIADAYGFRASNIFMMNNKSLVSALNDKFGII